MKQFILSELEKLLSRRRVFLDTLEIAYNRAGGSFATHNKSTGSAKLAFNGCEPSTQQVVRSFSEGVYYLNSRDFAYLLTTILYAIASESPVAADGFPPPLLNTFIGHFQHISKSDQSLTDFLSYLDEAHLVILVRFLQWVGYSRTGSAARRDDIDRLLERIVVGRRLAEKVVGGKGVEAARWVKRL